jgi:hypothetical protein
MALRIAGVGRVMVSDLSSTCCMVFSLKAPVKPAGCSE